jgi:hypothetical protein
MLDAMKRSLFALALLAGCASAPEPAVAPREAVKKSSTPVVAQAPERPRPRRGTVDLDVVDAPVTEVLADVGRQIERPVLFLGPVDARITLSVHEAPWSPIVEFIARNAHLDVREERRALVFRPHEKNVIAASGAEGKTLVRLLAAQTGKSVVISNDVHGEVDLLLKDVSWDRALRITAATLGCDVVEDGDAPVVIGPPR